MTIRATIILTKYRNTESGEVKNFTSWRHWHIDTFGTLLTFDDFLKNNLVEVK